MAISRDSGDILNVLASMSTKIGVAFMEETTSAVDMKVKEGTKTASPSVIPNAIREILQGISTVCTCNAMLNSNIFSQLFFKLSYFGTGNIFPMFKHVKNTSVDILFQSVVLSA